MEEIGIMNFTWPDVTQKIIPVLNFYKYVFFSAFVVWLVNLVEGLLAFSKVTKEIFFI